MEPNPADDPVIEFHDVDYVLPNGQLLLSKFNLKVRAGETLVLLGRSDYGKTTTLKLINRLLTPSGGEVRVNGASTAEAEVIRLRRSIGYVIQDVRLLPISRWNEMSAWCRTLNVGQQNKSVAVRKSYCTWLDLTRNSPHAIRMSFPAASGSVSAWRGRWPRTPRSC